jgi:hypothetical protein
MGARQNSGTSSFLGWNFYRQLLDANASITGLGLWWIESKQFAYS